jgi:putative PIN family toxin of toxin-antitoxin system
MRAVLDPNVLIAALLSPRGAPARLLRAWLDGAFELMVSAAVLAELERALAYPKLRRRISEEDAQAFVEVIRRSATTADDPAHPAAVTSRDPGDDYLLALAVSQQAVLVSGDNDLLEIEGALPIYTARDFLALVAPENG